jgi:hypothetical protein
MPGAPEAAVGHLGGLDQMAVDPDLAEVQRPADPVRPRGALGPDRRGEPVHAVAQGDCLVLAAEFLNRDDGAEDLVLDHLVALLQARHDRGGKEVPAMPPVRSSAGPDGGSRRQPVDIALHPGQLALVLTAKATNCSRSASRPR